MNWIQTSNLIALSLTAVQLIAQSPAPAKPKPAAAKAAKSAVPRGPDGKPDLTGVYQSNTSVRGTWEDANAGVGLGGTGTNPSAPKPLPSSDRQTREGAPYQPWAAKKVLEAYNRRGIDDPTALCLPPGIPRITSVGLFPIQIVHTPKQIVILYEYMNQFRVIPLNAKHPDDVVPTYLGDSVGHWEGDTMVMDITGFNDKFWLIGAGTFHTEDLHITERYTRIDKDQIDYEAVMEDPNVFTKPWTYRTNLMLREGTRVREYVCPENNLDPGRYEQLIKSGVKIDRQ